MYFGAYYNENALTYFCDKCGTEQPLPLYADNGEDIVPHMFKYVDVDKAILKDGKQIICPSCGNIHNSDTPLLKDNRYNAPNGVDRNQELQNSEENLNVPTCPICKSTNLKKYPHQVKSVKVLHLACLRQEI